MDIDRYAEEGKSNEAIQIKNIDDLHEKDIKLIMPI